MSSLCSKNYSGFFCGAGKLDQRLARLGFLRFQRCPARRAQPSGIELLWYLVGGREVVECLETQGS